MLTSPHKLYKDVLVNINYKIQSKSRFKAASDNSQTI